MPDPLMYIEATEYVARMVNFSNKEFNIVWRVVEAQPQWPQR